MTFHICHKKTFFCSYFQHISPCFYSNFNQESLLDVELNYATNEYPLGILLMDPTTPKTINRHVFQVIFLIFGLARSIKSMLSDTHWMKNLISHPTRSLDRNLSKNIGRYVKNTHKKSSFFNDTYPQIYTKSLFWVTTAKLRPHKDITSSN